MTGRAGAARPLVLAVLGLLAAVAPASAIGLTIVSSCSISPTPVTCLGAATFTNPSGSYVFDTDQAKLIVNGTVVGSARVVPQAGGPPDLVVYDFTTVDVGVGATVTIVGPVQHRPAVIAATGAVTVAGKVSADNGRPGASAASTAGADPGGGGAGEGPGTYIAFCQPADQLQCNTPLTGGGGGGAGSYAPGIVGCTSNTVVDVNSVSHSLAGGIGGMSYLALGAPLQVGAGGGGGGDRPLFFGQPGVYGHGNGGRGGGAVFITTTAAVTISGIVDGNGVKGGNSLDGGGGGGGGGGYVMLRAGTLTVSSSGAIRAAQGQGGDPTFGNPAGVCGGAGGGGIVEVEASAVVNQGTITAGSGLLQITQLGAGGFRIAGRVTDLNGTGIGGASVALSGARSVTAVTDPDGDYDFGTVPSGGAYTITPSLGGFTFTPASRTLPNLAQDELTQDFTVATGLFRRYFAEGATIPPFDTRIALLNATGAPATGQVTFQPSSGANVTVPFTLGTIARATIDPKTLGLTNAEFSTVIESTQPVIADRTMSWDARRYGSHAETSVAAPRTQWFLAEGATIQGFDLFYLLQNAEARDADIRVTYLLRSGAPLTKVYTVGARSRRTIWVNHEELPENSGQFPLEDVEVSAVIDSLNSVPVIVERAMYLDSAGLHFAAGHESAAVPGPAEEWFFAEGTTAFGFDLFLLLANPDVVDSAVEVTYLLPDGSTVVRTYTVPAQSRYNIWVNRDAALASTDLSAIVRTTNAVPVVAERAMWWGGPVGQWAEAHNSAGALRAGTKWGLADGQVDVSGTTFGAREDTYVLIANTSAFAGTARVTLVFEDAASPTSVTRDFALAATSRRNVNVVADFPEAIGRRFGVVVDSIGTTPAQIVVERAMYNDAMGVTYAAGSNSLGTRLR